jgi:acetolactate synthase I/III small subunit
MKEPSEYHTIVVTVLNRIGVIARITSLLSARGYNIENVIAAPTENYDIYKIHIGLIATEKETEQVVKQLHKLIDTLKVADISHKNNYIVREFLIMKVHSGKNRSEIFSLCDTFRAKVVDVGQDHITIDFSGPVKKVERFIDLLKPYGITELVRSGRVAMSEN